MAHIDPLAAATLPSGRFQLKLHDTAPEDVTPNGDRYLIEVIDIDEQQLRPSNILVVTQSIQKNDRSPTADPTIENRGVIAAVIIKAGNGHLLGLSDFPPPESSWFRSRPVYYAPQSNIEITNAPGDITVEPEVEIVPVKMERPWASVPMFFEPGDVVLVDYTARGRGLRIIDRECRLVNQIDILAKVEGVRLHRVNGAWVQEE